MSADIIPFAKRGAPPENPGNGAREALVDLAQSLPNDTGQNDAEKWADWILMELWVRGFKIVPID